MRNRVVLALAFLFIVISESGSVLALPPPPRDPNEDPKGTTGALKEQIQTGGSYSAYSGNATRVVTDLSVPDALGDYGLAFTRYWNSVHSDYEDNTADWPRDFGHSGWSHAWKWTAVYNAETIEPEPGPGEFIHHMAITITFPDGHTNKYKIVRSSWEHGGDPGDDRLGPYYTPEEITMSWPYGGTGVRDHLTKMAVDGSEFRLSLADGGSVHFVRTSAANALLGYYRATEVFDPHGLKTELIYTGDYLTEVRQEGGRSLFITRSTIQPGGWWVITKVESGGTAGFQRVSYNYTRVGAHLVLSTATYENDPVPGQNTQAVYTYGGAEAFEFPVLTRADDPRYGGAMTKIRYAYRGAGCALPSPTPPWQPPLYVPAQPYAIASETSDTGALVSSFQLSCETGERVEQNGLGGSRKFYFGTAAGTTSFPLACQGFQLGKVTDFTTALLLPGTQDPQGLPSHRQNFDGSGQPRQIWDGRSTMTEETVSPGDASGSPSKVHYVGADGSSIFYDRLTETGSDSLHPTRMYNENKRWLFRKTDENVQTTAYYRDSRRRIKQIVYPENSQETFKYDNDNPDGLNLLTEHTLPSHSGPAPAIEFYHYNGLHQLEWEENSVDGPGARKEYWYDSLGRVSMMRDGVAQNANPPAAFTAKMTYNARHQVTSVEYPATGGGSNPMVHYEYDKYGNCTAITNELGHRSTYTYDAYRRCTSLTEQLNGPGADCNNVATRRWDWIYDRVIDDVGYRPALSHTSKEWRVQVEPAFNAAGGRRVTARTHDVNNRITSEQTGWIQPPGKIMASNPWVAGAGRRRDAALHLRRERPEKEVRRFSRARDPLRAQQAQPAHEDD